MMSAFLARQMYWTTCRNSWSRPCPYSNPPLRTPLARVLPNHLMMLLCASAVILCGRCASGDVSKQEARRIRQVIEASRASYLAFDNFVCRLRIRVGEANRPSSTSAPEITKIHETAEARWIRKGDKQYYEVLYVQSPPAASGSGEMTRGGHIFPQICVHDRHHMMIRNPPSKNKDDIVQLSISDDVKGAPMEMLHTWNTYGYMYNDLGVVGPYLAAYLAMLSNPRKYMRDYTVVRQDGRKLDKITLDLQGRPPTQSTSWVDPSRGYLVIRNVMEALKGRSGRNFRRVGVIVEARPFGKRWFPWKARAYHDYGEAACTCFKTEVIELKLGAARDADFAVDLPRGATVRIWDNSLRMRKIDEPIRVTLDELPRLFDEISALPARHSTRKLVVRKNRSRWWQWTLLAVGTSLLAVGLYIKLRRR